MMLNINPRSIRVKEEDKTDEITIKMIIGQEMDPLSSTPNIGSVIEKKH